MQVVTKSTHLKQIISEHLHQFLVELFRCSWQIHINADSVGQYQNGHSIFQHEAIMDSRHCFLNFFDY